jgi:integrase
VTIALNTGMRQGELLALRWEATDFSRGVILLERTKSGKRREVPMTAACDATLNAMPGDKVEGRVFHKATGAAWGSIRTAWDNAGRARRLSLS